MSTGIVPLAAPQMAALAPNWSAMRTAIAECEHIDEIKTLADKAVAIRAYYAQSRDIDNEVKAMRIRVRAERRMGELIEREQEAGRLATRGGNGSNQHAANVDSNDISTLSDLGIPRDRSARAQELARVPEEQFEAALATEERPSLRRIASLAPPKSSPPAPRAAPQIDVRPVLETWGTIRDFANKLDDGLMLPAGGAKYGAPSWHQHPGIQQFQVDEIRRALPRLIAYLKAMEEA